MDSGEEVSCGLFVTRGDCPEVFDGVEEAFDEIAFGIEREVAAALDLAVGLWRDDGGDRTDGEVFNEAVGVVSLVGDHALGFDLGTQRFGLGNVVSLTAGEADGEGIAQGIDDGMDFRRQSATRTADGLVRAPFFSAPALC